jgi:hypothetical protein
MPIEQRDGFRLWVGGPVPRGSDGITIGSLVIVRAGKQHSAHLLRHERVHVRQWRRYGVIGFTTRYLGSYVLWRLRRKGHRGAYLRIPLEVEAEWVARRSIETAVRDRLPAEVVSP